MKPREWSHRNRNREKGTAINVFKYIFIGNLINHTSSTILFCNSLLLYICVLTQVLNYICTVLKSLKFELVKPPPTNGKLPSRGLMVCVSSSWWPYSMMTSAAVRKAPETPSPTATPATAQVLKPCSTSPTWSTRIQTEGRSRSTRPSSKPVRRIFLKTPKNQS